jgi:hypothetical protein
MRRAQVRPSRLCATPVTITTMSEIRKKRSPLLWIIVAIGVAMLVATTAITAIVFLMMPTGPTSLSMTKHFEAPALAPVTGTVTLDGKPLKHAIVKFVPIVDLTKSPRRGLTSFGITDADGKFEMTYATDADGKPILGAEIGPHQVQIQVNDLTGEQVIAANCGTSKSDLKADVKQGMLPHDIALKSVLVEAPK